MCFLVGKSLIFSLIRLRTLFFRIHRRWNIEEYHSRSNHSIDVVATLALRQRHRCRHGQSASLLSGWSFDLDFFRRNIFIPATSFIEIWTVPIVWSNPMDASWSLISVSLESISKTMKMFRERTMRAPHYVAINEARVQRSHRMATSWLFDRKPVDRYFVIDKGFYPSAISHRHPSLFRYTVVGSPYWVRTIDCSQMSLSHVVFLDGTWDAQRSMLWWTCRHLLVRYHALRGKRIDSWANVSNDLLSRSSDVFKLIPITCHEPKTSAWMYIYSIRNTVVKIARNSSLLLLSLVVTSILIRGNSDCRERCLCPRRMGDFDF